MTQNQHMFANLEWAQRLKIMNACGEAGGEFHHRTAEGFRVAVGVGKYSKLVQSMGDFGFECVGLYEFPLGTDTPAPHLRHNGNWLFADFK